MPRTITLGNSYVSGRPSGIAIADFSALGLQNPSDTASSRPDRPHSKTHATCQPVVPRISGQFPIMRLTVGKRFKLVGPDHALRRRYGQPSPQAPNSHEIVGCIRAAAAPSPARTGQTQPCPFFH